MGRLSSAKAPSATACQSQVTEGVVSIAVGDADKFCDDDESPTPNDTSSDDNDLEECALQLGEKAEADRIRIAVKQIVLIIAIIVLTVTF